MTLPNFLIIGAQKSGTSSLYRHLRAHPEVFMSRRKEPKYFALESEEFGFKAPYTLPDAVDRYADLQRYQELFEGADGALAIGEASTWYLHTPGTPERIHRHVPEMKLVAILRNPVKRAYSNFLHNRNYLEIEPLGDFGTAVAAEEKRLEEAWGHPWYYKDKGRYYKHLRRFYALFDADQIRVYLLEDLKRNPVELLHDLYRFLELDDTFTPDFSQRYNVSAQNTRSESVHTFLDKPHPIKTVLKPLVPTWLRRQLKSIVHERNRVKPTIEPAIYLQIQAELRDDILNLQELIERDLSVWLRPPN